MVITLIYVPVVTLMVITLICVPVVALIVITLICVPVVALMVITLICVPVVALMVIVGQPVVTKENKHIYFLKNGPKHRKYPGFYEYLATDVTSRTYGTKI
jgi:hypothetical protein